MKWMQFFTPAKSMDFKETQNYISQHASDEITILDVRQPAEYRESHIPGATLIPLPELSDRISELDPEKPTMVYWAVGGRSRVAAQMLSGKGFKEVYNVSGGIKAWQSKKAVGPMDSGMAFFTGKEDPLDILKTAYSMELGLREFYLTMGKKAKNEKVKDLFLKLSEIEIKHQTLIYQTYCDISQSNDSEDEFKKTVNTKALEGGLSTKEYLDLFKPDLNSETDVISLAMSIEAQALDLYQRVSSKISNIKSKNIVNKIADEEKVHLQSLGKLLDSL